MALMAAPIIADQLNLPIANLAEGLMMPFTLLGDQINEWMGLNRTQRPPPASPPPRFDFNPFAQQAQEFCDYYNAQQEALTYRLQIEAEVSIRERMIFRAQQLEERARRMNHEITLRTIREHNANIPPPIIKAYQNELKKELIKIEKQQEENNLQIEKANKDIEQYIKSQQTQPIIEPKQPKNKPIKKEQLLEPSLNILLEEEVPDLIQPKPPKVSKPKPKPAPIPTPIPTSIPTPIPTPPRRG